MLAATHSVSIETFAGQARATLYVRTNTVALSARRTVAMKSPPFSFRAIGVTSTVVSVPDRSDSLYSPTAGFETIAPPPHPPGVVMVGTASVPLTRPHTCASAAMETRANDTVSMIAFFMRASCKEESTAVLPYPHRMPWRRFVVALALALFVAGLLVSQWTNGFAPLLFRTVTLALVGVGVYSLFERWPRTLPRWLARWALQVVGVGVAMPLTTLAV